jgi:hypothetical protein
MQLAMRKLRMVWMSVTNLEAVGAKATIYVPGQLMLSFSIAFKVIAGIMYVLLEISNQQNCSAHFFVGLRMRIPKYY